MKKVAFIPVKLNNERAPGKNTKKFDDGTPLITFFQRQLLTASCFDRIYVFCSSESIKDYLCEGVEFLKRPEWLDTKEATPQNIMREFINVVPADIYAVCHCTSPFVSPEHIQECVQAVEGGEYDSSFTAEKIQRLMWNDNNKPLNFDPENVPRTQELPIYYNEVSAAYVFRKEVFEKYNRRIGIKPHITIVGGTEAIDIDYPEDFIIANALYMNIVLGKDKT